MEALKLVLISLLVAVADAFWRMECRGRVGLARIDPMVSPGEISAHAHIIHGSSGEFVKNFHHPCGVIRWT
jgi:hypothetical protein